MSKISSSIGYHDEWETALIVKDRDSLNEIFSQAFTYIGSGAEAYVFVSQDQKYVIKFFKMKHLTPEKWLEYIPFPGLGQYRDKKIDKREKRLNQTFGTLKLAYEELRDETGLVFIHLNRSNDLKKRIHLIHRNGKEFTVSLDEVPFILQKKAELIYPYLTQLMEKKDISAATKGLKSFLELIWNRENKGFIDQDKGVTNNFGFVEDKAIQIDTGGLVRIREAQVKDSSKQWLRSAKEISRIGKKLELWIIEHYPELLPELHQLMVEFTYGNSSF